MIASGSKVFGGKLLKITTIVGNDTHVVIACEPQLLFVGDSCLSGIMSRCGFKSCATL